MQVSVVIPTRDRPEMLALTLRTVFWQERVELEILVVDDGAGPGTRDAVERFADSRIRLLGNAGPSGVSGARNTGIAAAAGEWIAFLDDDDLWAPVKLVTQLSAADEIGAKWVYTGHVTVNSRLDICHGAPPPPPDVVVAELRRHNAVPAGSSSVAVRRDLLDRIGGFDPILKTSEDWDMWLRLSAAARPACVARPLVALRQHAGMASRAADRMLADIEVIATRHRIPLDRARHLRWAGWMSLESGRRWSASRYYAAAAAAGDVISAGRALVALIYPQIAITRTRVSTDDWVEEAHAWLAGLRPQVQVSSAEEQA